MSNNNQIESEGQVPANHSHWILAVLASVVFMAVASGTMVNIALPYVGRDFAVTEGTYGWMSTGYSLSFGIFSAVNGRLGDIVGLRRLYMCGLVVLAIGAVGVSFAPTIEVAIGLRIMQGAGAAALPVMGSSIISGLFAEKRGWAMGIIMSTVGVAASIGPFLGGFLVELGGWRAAFLFPALVILIIPVVLKILPESLDDVAGSPFDWVGAIVLSTGIAVTIYAFEVLQDFGFGLTFVLTIAFGFCGLVAFWIRINRATNPFASPRLLRDFRYIATAMTSSLANATRFGSIILVPIFLTEVNDVSPIWIGVALFPGALLIALTSSYAGRMADAGGSRRPILAGTIAIVLGNFVTACFAGGSIIGVAAGMGLYGLGLSFIQSPAISAVSLVIPKKMIGTGMGIYMMIFFIGGAFGATLSITAVELQPIGAASWLGFTHLGEGARYSNAILVLTALAIINIFLNPMIPPKGAEPR